MVKHAHDMEAICNDAGTAAEAAASAARAAHKGARMQSKMHFKLILALAMEQPIAFDTDSVIHRGHVGGSPRLMSPFFDQEPDKSKQANRAKLPC